MLFLTHGTLYDEVSATPHEAVLAFNVIPYTQRELFSSLFLLSFVTGLNNAVAAHFVKVVISLDIKLRRNGCDNFSRGGHCIPACLLYTSDAADE